MKILVTGASGFIGQHLVRELDDAGHDITGVDLRHGQDLRRPNAAMYHLTLNKPDVCVHLAAKVGRLFGETDPSETVADNAGMTTLVAQACGELGIRLVYASTSEIYGDCRNQVAFEDVQAWTAAGMPEDGTWPAETVRHPHNIYGLSKRWGEEACHLYARRGLTIWRISMPYGPGLPAGRGRAAIINFLDQAQRRVPIPVHNGAERSWCWIGDTVRAMRLTIERTQSGVFNIGRDDNPTSMFDVAKIACDLTGAPHSLIELVDAPARQTVVKRLSTHRLQALGWEPHISLPDGMARTLAAMNRHAVAA